MNNHPKTATTLLERLGNVIYWAGCIIAPLVAFWEYNVDGILWAVICGAPAYLLGLATRYVLTGRGWRRKNL